MVFGKNGQEELSLDSSSILCPCGFNSSSLEQVIQSVAIRTVLCHLKCNKYWKRLNQETCCKDILLCVMTKICVPSKVDSVCLHNSFKKMHKSFLKRFHQIEQQQFMSICGGKHVMHASNWSIDTHRLIILSLLYDTAGRVGNEGVWSMLHDPEAKSKIIKNHIKQCHGQENSLALRRSI